MILQTSTIISIIFAFIVSLLISGFQYYFREKSKASFVHWLFVLRTLGLFFLLIAIINPVFTFESFTIEKPQLYVLVDQSKSIQFLKEEKNLTKALNEIKSNKDLLKKFDINAFQFGREFNIMDTLSFSSSQTNIARALLQINKIGSERNDAVVMLSDGNQTEGFDYKNYNSVLPVFPVVFGDTVSFDDIFISQLNVNKYTYVGNEFPVEAFVSLKSNLTTTVSVAISNKNKIVARKKLKMAPNSSKKITFTLTSKQKGNQFFRLEVSALNNEKNIANNSQKFSIESIDEKSKILIVSSIVHPDLGSLRRSIESNEKRSVEIKNPREVSSIENYQSIVLYQPNEDFQKTFELTKQTDKNLLIITGTQTDFAILNNQNLGFRKNAILDTEKVTPLFNSNFLPFQQEDIGFEGFSPLADVFGEIIFSRTNHVLLSQRLNGIETDQPLLVTSKQGNRKMVVLFGEGIWQWRASSYLKEESFESFDNFINNLIQFTTNSSLKNRLEVDVDPIHYSSQPVVFLSYFFDENFQFDQNAELELRLTEESSQEKYNYPFSKLQNRYSIQIDNLRPGKYQYSVLERRSNIVKTGEIEVLAEEIEAQFTNANHKDLQVLALNSKGRLFFKEKTSSLIDTLNEDTRFKSIQKSIQEKRSLLDWWQYLLFVVVLFTAEWFIRKYHGKI